MSDYKHIFGPVPSRRLGFSLGVDLTPGKACSLDCVYCQIGKTQIKTTEPSGFVPTREVIEELDRWFSSGGCADHITLSGSGEPTLHSGFGDILTHIKARSSIPSVLLSNGSLFFRSDIRQSACKASLVKATLSCWDQDSFVKIHRPADGLSFEQYFEGLTAFRRDYRGEFWLEVFALQGMNSGTENMQKLACLAAKIMPDKVHLNTVARPPMDKSAIAVPLETLEACAVLFSPAAEIVAECKGRENSAMVLSEASVLGLLKRHACTVSQLSSVFRCKPESITGLLAPMEKSGKIRAERTGNDVFYVSL
ncbi:MAG: radical SAM protein [Lentisphaerota bacterium]